MMTANEIREAYKRFFEEQGHLIVPSAPMVIKDDPTLMFTNAGMNQFKDIILGHAEPKSRRQADSQKCLRVSGKHNDLEEVGHDTYHHTMFEMLGNWSFGDYFKEDAIVFAYKFLVDVLGLDSKDLYVSVFEGSKEEGLERDDEAAAIWERYFPKDHIIDGNKHDNFWEMGDTGPCGPCSEIHYDGRTAEEKAQVPGASLVNKDNPQVIEIWNLVFMQFNRKADGSLEGLPAKVIDTGMGFERLVRVLQGKNSNYDTDVFQPIIKKIAELSGFDYGKNEPIDVAMRVIADHLRAIAFSIADGQLPSNAKAGYVIRRILRRAVRYAYTFLNRREAFICQLVPTLVAEMGEAYPELKAQQELITKVIREEEESFLRTLSTGIHLLEGVIAETKAAGKTVIDGTKAFTLFDTYGFPFDLTQLICGESGMTVDEEGFKQQMQQQKERARNAAAVETGDWVVIAEGETAFKGWDFTEYGCRILKYRQVQQKKQTYFELVLDNTPFYAEMGGQVGDQGVLVNEAETIEIFDTKRENNLPIHLTKKLPADPTAEFMACVDLDKRRACEANHTATHLIDQALREVLGTHVEQKGSLVTPQSLRFDFSHFQKVTPEEIRAVERLVNARIRENLPLQEHRDIDIAEAKAMGAIALFGEKYGDKVRVVQFGDSIEFCGGCHAAGTGNLGLFRIVSESSVAAGVRRIEAITGEAAEELMYLEQDMLTGVRNFFNNAKDVTAAVKKAIDENSELRKQVEIAIKERVGQLKGKLIDEAREADGVKIVSGVIPMDISPDFVKDLAFQISGQLPASTLVVLGSKHSEKPLLTVMLSKDLMTDRGLHAGNLVKEAARLIQGGGGGAPHFATAGGKNVAGLDAAVAKVLELSGF
ncbi:alanine--tRNA ligase [Alloprevotella sp. OH1205_COT-284]|uniref:alanine--tRNA ligase n=1 Tax=Alloprevotella sp. OH1205_COT-284 TaxID=2491043 RepID=UPI000F5E93DF|nr:alanine--tRNA ligase [Alloprevotella sp. OH1205_COT-284]RRD80017.1 alanine--tRNA ligase [Alloprevotella sp. OH1205_COT-284]